jgi:hypothetical protein
VTLIEADTLLSERLHREPWNFPEDTSRRATAALRGDLAAWYGEQDLQLRTAALIWATRLLDEQVNWFGHPLTRTQALAWPMTGQVDQYGRIVSQETIPIVIQRATAFYALALLRDQSESVQALDGQQNIRSLSLGDTTIAFQQAPRPSSWRAAQMIPPDIRHMLRWYGTIAGSAMVPLRRC